MSGWSIYVQAAAALFAAVAAAGSWFSALQAARRHRADRERAIKGAARAVSSDLVTAKTEFVRVLNFDHNWSDLRVNQLEVPAWPSARSVLFETLTPDQLDDLMDALSGLQLVRDKAALVVPEQPISDEDDTVMDGVVGRIDAGLKALAESAATRRWALRWTPEEHDADADELEQS